MDTRHIKSSFGIRNIISNPTGMGLGFHYVTWRKIHKCPPPPPRQIFVWDTKLNFQSYVYRVRN